MKELDWFNIVAWSIVSFCCCMSWYHSIQAKKSAEKAVKALQDHRRGIGEVWSSFRS